MIAKIKTWYSIQWQALSYSNEDSFKQLMMAPKFFYVDRYIPSLRLHLEEKFPNLYIADLFETKIFLEKNGEILPTHYKAGQFEPGDNERYDLWLIGFHESTIQELKRIKQRFELNQTKIFLEYSNRVIRHDMHSGINTYMPRGLTILKARLPQEIIDKYKLAMGLTLLEKGLRHAQGVYEGVRSFTGMVREGHTLEMDSVAIDEALIDYLKMTAYSKHVEVGPIPAMKVNKSLFLSALNVFVRNGINFNKSKDKKVKVYFDNGDICIKDNGTGLNQEQFDIIVYPKDEDERVPGFDNMDMNIAMVILREHNMIVVIEEGDANPGTTVRIKKMA